MTRESCTIFLLSEPPKGTNNLCPRLNGFYAHPDTSINNVYYFCIDGVARELTCCPGLSFDQSQGLCTNGYSTYGYHRFADPSDCAKYFVCSPNGVSYYERQCEFGLVYNEDTQSCDAPTNVPEWWVDSYTIYESFLSRVYTVHRLSVLHCSKDYYAFLDEIEAENHSGNWSEHFFSSF